MKKIIVLFFIASLGLSVNAQWSIDSLNSASSTLFSSAANNKVVFADGTEWNVFDVNTNTHTFGWLAQSRSLIDIAKSGDKIYFGGGKFGSFADPQYSKYVDVYNSATDTWSTLNLSKNREVGGAGAIGNKVLFAGGTGRSDISGPVYMYRTVDIFDAITGMRTSANLSQGRSNIAVGATGNKIVFAGGWYWDFSYSVLPSNRADIYDVVTNTWTKSNLSKKREDICAAVVGDKIIFAGGFGPSGAVKNVDIYNATSNSWSTTNLITANYAMISAVVDNKAYFAGGTLANLVQVYDATLNSWSSFTIPVNLTSFKMNAINGKIYFSGGYDAGTSMYSNLVQIYDPFTSSWTNEYLSLARTLGGVAVANSVGVFAGGIIGYTYPMYTSTNRVDFFSAPLRSGSDEITTFSNLSEAVFFPNPFTHILFAKLSETQILPATIYVSDMDGKLLKTQQTNTSNIELDFSQFNSRIFVVEIIDGSGKRISQVVIKQ